MLDALHQPDTVVQLGLHPGLELPGATGPALEQQEKEDILEENIASICKHINASVQQNVECRLHECPRVLHDEFMLLFPGINVELGELRIITLSERTENDMTGWSQSVEEEREELLGHVSIITILKRLIPILLDNLHGIIIIM